MLLAVCLLLLNVPLASSAARSPHGTGLAIFLPPHAQTAVAGSQVSFTVGATGTGTVNYQWFHNGGEVPGATGHTLTIPAARTEDSGLYEVVVTDDVSSLTSTAVGLGIYRSPGTIDQTFRFSNPPNSGVTAIAQLPNGNIAIGGLFTRVNSTSNNRTRFAVLTPTGGLVNLNENPSYNDRINGIAAQPDGKFIVAHNQGFERRLANGGFDNSFPSNFDAPFGAVAISGDWAYLGGQVTGATIRRININTGMEDTTFAANAVTETGWYVTAIFVQNDGKILVGGTASHVYRLNTDGTPDTSFMGTGANLFLATTYDFAETADGRLWAAGTQQSSPSNNFPYLVPMNTDGTIDNSIGAAGINAPVYTLQAVGNDLLVGGTFTVMAGDTSYPGLVRVKGADGLIDENFLPILPTPSVDDLLLQPDGNVLVAGSYLGNVSRVTRIAPGYEIPLTVTGDPRSVTLVEGEDLTLSVGWQGNSEATYQWFKGMDMLPGQTGQNLVELSATSESAGDYRVEVTDITGTVSSALASVTITPSTLTFAAWAQQNGLMPGEDQPDDDADADGIPNFEEFVFGLDPKTPDAAPGATPQFIIVESTGKDYPGVSFRRARDIEGYQIEIEAVETILSPSPESTVEESVTDLGNGVDLIVYRTTTELETLGSIFFKVRLINTAP